MGEKQNQPFQLSFNASLKVDFQGSRITSDGGLILVREMDERLSFGELIAQHLTDSRRGKNTQLPLADLLRQSVYFALNHYLLDLIERNLILPAVVELRRARRLVVGDVLRGFERPLVLQVRGDAG